MLLTYQWRAYCDIFGFERVGALVVVPYRNRSKIYRYQSMFPKRCCLVAKSQVFSNSGVVRGVISDTYPVPVSFLATLIHKYLGVQLTIKRYLNRFVVPLPVSISIFRQQHWTKPLSVSIFSNLLSSIVYTFIYIL